MRGIRQYPSMLITKSKGKSVKSGGLGETRTPDHSVMSGGL